MPKLVGYSSWAVGRINVNGQHKSLTLWCSQRGADGKSYVWEERETMPFRTRSEFLGLLSKDCTKWDRVVEIRPKDERWSRGEDGWYVLRTSVRVGGESVAIIP